MRQRETTVPFISSHRTSSYSLFTTATPCHEHSSLLFISGMRTSYSSISTNRAKLALADKENLRDALRTLKSVFHLSTTNSHDHLKNRSGRRGSNSQLSAWEFRFSIFYFQHLQNCSIKIACMHCIPCMRCLICVSPGDVLGDVFYHALLLTTSHLKLIISTLSKTTCEAWLRNYLRVQPSTVSTREAMPRNTITSHMIIVRCSTMAQKQLLIVN